MGVQPQEGIKGFPVPCTGCCMCSPLCFAQSGTRKVPAWYPALRTGFCKDFSYIRHTKGPQQSPSASSRILCTTSFALYTSRPSPIPPRCSPDFVYNALCILHQKCPLVTSNTPGQHVLGCGRCRCPGVWALCSAFLAKIKYPCRAQPP